MLQLLSLDSIAAEVGDELAAEMTEVGDVMEVKGWRGSGSWSWARNPDAEEIGSLDGLEPEGGAGVGGFGSDFDIGHFEVFEDEGVMPVVVAVVLEGLPWTLRLGVVVASGSEAFVGNGFGEEDGAVVEVQGDVAFEANRETGVSACREINGAAACG
jgi:hypothetical protein